MFKTAYAVVMDDNKNALHSLNKITKFQLMNILAYMWCAIFSVGIGSFFFFGTSVLLHFLILLGVFFTADLFNKARQHKLDHRLAFKDKDGGARYDDIWGGA